MALCDTEYPILLVHGMGFRDRKIFNYWGRIPKILEKNGATVFYGKQDANASIERNAELLADEIDKIIEISGAEKLNVIAHSKGGLDMRYLISSMGKGEHIASLTTISTPHNGSVTVQKILDILPKWFVKAVAKIVDGVMKINGDKSSDSYRVFHQLSTDFAEEFNRNNPDDENVYYQSYGFTMKYPFSDIFLTPTNILVLCIEGANDGFLPERAVKWTNYQGTFSTPSIRGISHADEVDARRMKITFRNSDGKYEISDITEFYVEIVEKLKSMGF